MWDSGGIGSSLACRPLHGARPNQQGLEPRGPPSHARRTVLCSEHFPCTSESEWVHCWGRLSGIRSWDSLRVFGLQSKQETSHEALA